MHFALFLIAMSAVISFNMLNFEVSPVRKLVAVATST